MGLVVSALVAAGAWCATVLSALSGDNATTIIVAAIGAIASIATAAIGNANRRHLHRLESGQRARRVVVTKQGTETVVTDEELDELSQDDTDD
jgi:hypothetical protein